VFEAVKKGEEASLTKFNPATKTLLGAYLKWQ
jgi:hypothetical protein